jgi:metal transporter CNNM
MWFTGIISYPLARLLDSLVGRSDGHGLFTREEIAAIIKYHNLSDNKSGTIGPDAVRVMLGALNLDSRKILGDISLIPEGSTEDEVDMEKADLVIHRGLIVHWSAVKTVNIDEVVDEGFIAKVTGWPYSRIPVTGDPEIDGTQDTPTVKDYRWEGKHIFGFLHVKVSTN